MAKIGRIACIVSIPVLTVSMVIIGIFAVKTDIRDNQIIFNGTEIISVTDEGGKITIKAADSVITETVENSELAEFKELLENNSKAVLIAYIESGFVFLIICLVLTVIMLKALEDLFNNIYGGDTPFTLENVGYIKKIAYLLIAVTVLPGGVGFIFEEILQTDLNLGGFGLFSLVEILFLFSIAYIFQYGYEIQLDSKGKMYGDENE